MNAILSSRLYIPRQQISDIGAMKKEVSLRYKEDDEYIKLTDLRQHVNYVSVPRQYGLSYCQNAGIKIDDRTATGFATNFKSRITLKPSQISLVDKMVRLAYESHDYLVRAHTGSGKTECALQLIAELGTTALVVVDMERLLVQWRERAISRLGLSDDDIGIVQGPNCSFEGKKLVIAMLQSLYRRSRPVEFYRWAGITVFDEFHVVGAPHFSEVMSLLPSRLRIGLSATERRDSLQKLINMHLGGAKVQLQKQHSVSKLYYLESNSQYSFYANVSSKMGRILTEVCEDSVRNELLASAVLYMHSTGRRSLAIGDRIEHLEDLMNLCICMGLPEEDCGLYTRHKTEYLLGKVSEQKKHPPGYERGSLYCPVGLVRVKKRQRPQDLDHTLKNKQIIFATYGMFAKAIDLPELSIGLDCTPRSEMEQIHGRILRPLPGKPDPVWVTTRDTGSYRLEHSFSRRIASFGKSNVEVYKWDIVDMRMVRKNLIELSQEAMMHSEQLRNDL